jgi:hypothetical protein
MNTMLADLDESLRRLLVAELERHDFGSIHVAFDAPARDWAAALSGPTLNLFLYDLRQAKDLHEAGWGEQRANGAARMLRPPLRLDCSYAVTAWARAIEDEHRLLSQAVAVLFGHERLPAGCLSGALAEPVAARYAPTARIGAAREEGRADFWSAVGGSYKASIDYVVTLTYEAGVAHERGPQVRSRAVRMAPLPGRPGRLEERQGVAGRLLDAEGSPVAFGWLVLPEASAFCTTDDDGVFRFDGIIPGRYRCLVRTDAGDDAEIELVVPNAAADIRLPKPQPKPKRARRR